MNTNTNTPAAALAARILAWLGPNGRENSASLLLYEAMQELKRVGTSAAVAPAVPRTHTTTAGESVMGIALRQLGEEARWKEVRDLNADRFPGMGPHDYYPVGTLLRLEATMAADEPVATIHVDGSFVHVEWRTHAPNTCHLDVYTRPAPVQALAPSDARADLDEVYSMLSIGQLARNLGTLRMNIENMERRSRCLSAIEGAFFTVATEPDPDEDGDEPGTECLLNWGSSPEEYVEQFRAALATISAAPQAGVQVVPADDDDSVQLVNAGDLGHIRCLARAHPDPLVEALAKRILAAPAAPQAVHAALFALYDKELYHEPWERTEARCFIEEAAEQKGFIPLVGSDEHPAGPYLCSSGALIDMVEAARAQGQADVWGMNAALPAAQPADAQDDTSRLIEHAACLGMSLRDGDADEATESWRSLPQHLQDAITAKEESIAQDRTQGGASA